MGVRTPHPADMHCSSQEDATSAVGGCTLNTSEQLCFLTALFSLITPFTPGTFPWFTPNRLIKTELCCLLTSASRVLARGSTHRSPLSTVTAAGAFKVHVTTTCVCLCRSLEYSPAIWASSCGPLHPDCRAASSAAGQASSPQP